MESDNRNRPESESDDRTSDSTALGQTCGCGELEAFVSALKFCRCE